MPRVLVSDALSDAGVAYLREAVAKYCREGGELTLKYSPGLKEDEIAAAISEYDALIIRSGSKVTAKVIDAASSLKVIGRAGIGVDNVDVGAATKRGIVVMNTPTGNAVTTAEHAIALLFSIARKIPQASSSMSAGKWEKSKFQGRELAGKTLGVLGLGNIGRIVADRARALQMKVIAFDPVLTKDRAAQLGVELVSKDELFARADAITAHAPLTDETRGIVDDAAIAKMKTGVLLVNCARGGIYDEAALERGLKSGKIGGVALDVFVTEPPGKHPLLEHAAVVATPHLGASTEEAQERVAIEIIDQVLDYLASGTITNAVNVPNVSREAAPKLRPYLVLARRLASFLAQVEGVHPRAIEVACSGEPVDLGAGAIVSAAVAGVVERFFEGPVNEVSAPRVAADRGIAVQQRVGSPRGKFAHVVTVRVTGEGGEEIAAEGIVGLDGTARLTRWGDYELDARLGGDALVLVNDNTPGVVGAVGTVLGRGLVNISQIHYGLNATTKQAVSIWSVDSPIPVEALAEIRRAPNVARAVAIALR